MAPLKNTTTGIVAFMLVTVDGFVDGVDGACDFWTIDDEFERFSDHQLETADRLLFGRITYEQMAFYWPSEQAVTNEPSTARLMNNLPKLVVSTTLNHTDWSPTDIVPSLDDLASTHNRATERTLLLGSPTLTGAMLEHGLIDELRLLINPVAIGNGRPLASFVRQQTHLELITVDRFHNGSVLVSYRPQDTGSDRNGH